VTVTTVNQRTILGIDPGTTKTGFAVLGQLGRSLTVLESGTISLPAGRPLAGRLALLQQHLESLIDRHRLDAVAVEDIFTARNVRSALALGHARGVVLAAAGRRELPVQAYPPATVKKAVVGHGRADKAQIQQMVRTLLSLDYVPKPDEADALAIAICHALCARAAAATGQEVVAGSNPGRKIKRRARS
jgi:crossover junction endodeoxyribonuclease RuvC